jgi:hypothetical protein
MVSIQIKEDIKIKSIIIIIMPKKFKIHPVIDNAENYYTKKDKIFDLPFRLNIIGKSQFSGKSNLIVNLLLKSEYYLNDFEGDNIYIISPSITTDNKLKLLIQVKEIPEENLLNDFDEDVLEQLYNNIQEDYEEFVDKGERPPNVLILFDDISFRGSLKTQRGIVSKLYCNGRHLNVSTILTTQKYTDINTTCRENNTGCILFSCSDRQLETVITDHNRLDNKKQFKKMFRKTTEEPYSFMVINYTNGFDEMYLNKHFEKIEYDDFK